MPNARVLNISGVCSLQAKSTAGVWRTLTEGSLIADHEEILVEADGPQFALDGYKLQRKSAGAWLDALTITLDLPSGTSHYRQDRIGVTGDDTNNMATILVTVDRGHQLLKDANAQLEASARNRFEYPAGSAIKYKGMSDDLTFTTAFGNGGQEPDYGGSILAPLRQFAGVVPVTGQHLKAWNGKIYRIDKVRVDEYSYVLEIQSLNKR